MFLRRIVLFCLALVLVAPAAVTNVQAQPASSQPVTLYAHSAGNATILNASPPTGPGEYSAVSNRIIFTLSPVLGEDVSMSGTLNYTLVLKATAPASGIASVWLSELKLSGQTVAIAGTNTSSSTQLSDQPHAVFLSIAAPIEYQFHAGSALQLNVVVSMQSSATPYLAWDLPTRLSTHEPTTSVKVPFLNPTQAEVEIEPIVLTQPLSLEANPNCDCVKAQISINLTDAIGLYRLNRTAVLTAPNGTARQVQRFITSIYSISYFYNGTLGVGLWKVTVRSLDRDGNTYSSERTAIVALVYKVTIHAVMASNEPLQSAEFCYSDEHLFGACATTDSAGNTSLPFPSWDLGVPINFTVTFSGTRSIYGIRLPYANPLTLLVRFLIYNVSVRPLIAGSLPLPGASVTLLQTGYVGQEVTGLDGIAHFGRLPAGNYVAQVYYLGTEADCNVNVNSSEVVSCYVPLRGVTITTAVGAVVVVATVTRLLVRRRRKFR